MLKNSKNIILICTLLLLAIFTFIKYVPAKTEISSDDNNYNKPSVHVSSSWAALSLTELFGYSDIVVSGKVINISDPKKSKLKSIEDFTAIYKDYSFVVEESFKGGIDPGKVIIIRVPGGEIDDFKYETDAVIPESNKHQTLFLKEYNNIADSQETTYAILTPRGKYILEKEQNLAINEFQESDDMNNLYIMLNDLRNDIGDEIILPRGFLQ